MSRSLPDTLDTQIRISSASWLAVVHGYDYDDVGADDADGFGVGDCCGFDDFGLFELAGFLNVRNYLLLIFG